MTRSEPLPTYRGRFAPSPTGDLHMGSLVAALGSWLMARAAGGEWLVRIENIDPPREVAGASERQLATLAACGLLPDGPVVRQSDRGRLYQAALNQLLAAGLAFECHCSRTDLAATGGVHRACVGGRARREPAIRLRVADGTDVAFDDLLLGPQRQEVDREVGDFVLRRADGLWAYQLAVVVDDAEQGITDVVRGADLLDSTARQILLQRALGLPTPRHAHLPLVVDGDGRKLSKSLASMPVDPTDPLPALRRAWALLGQSPSVVRGYGDARAFPEAALRQFDPGRIPRATVPVAAMHNSALTKPH